MQRRPSSTRGAGDSSQTFTEPPPVPLPSPVANCSYQQDGGHHQEGAGQRREIFHSLGARGASSGRQGGRLADPRPAALPGRVCCVIVAAPARGESRKPAVGPWPRPPTGAAAPALCLRRTNAHACTHPPPTHRSRRRRWTSWSTRPRPTRRRSSRQPRRCVDCQGGEGVARSYRPSVALPRQQTYWRYAAWEGATPLASPPVKPFCLPPRTPALPDARRWAARRRQPR